MAQTHNITQAYTIFKWALIATYIIVQIVLVLTATGKMRPDKEFFDNKLVIIMIIPTIAVSLIVGFIYFRCKGILHEKAIKNRADRELEIKVRMKYYGVEYFDEQNKPKN